MLLLIENTLIENDVFPDDHWKVTFIHYGGLPWLFIYWASSQAEPMRDRDDVVRRGRISVLRLRDSSPGGKGNCLDSWAPGILKPFVLFYAPEIKDLVHLFYGSTWTRTVLMENVK